MLKYFLIFRVDFIYFNIMIIIVIYLILWFGIGGYDSFSFINLIFDISSYNIL